jgi:hypothetical protein
MQFLQCGLAGAGAKCDCGGDRSRGGSRVAVQTKISLHSEYIRIYEYPGEAETAASSSRPGDPPSAAREQHSQFFSNAHLYSTYSTLPQSFLPGLPGRRPWSLVCVVCCLCLSVRLSA